MHRHAQKAQAVRAALAPVAGPALAHIFAGLQKATDPEVRAAARRLFFTVADAAGLAPPALDCSEEELAGWMAEHLTDRDHEGVPFTITRRRGRWATAPVKTERRRARLGRWLRRLVRRVAP